MVAKKENGQEVVVMGKGIGVNYAKGSFLKHKDYERVYVLTDEKISDNLIQLSRDIPDKFFEIASRVIEYSKEQNIGELHEHIYVSLTDHLFFAAERQARNLYSTNTMTWEIKKFYPIEYRIGKYALHVMLEELGEVFPEEEASNIAFHFINAQNKEESYENNVLIVETIKDIVRIVNYQFDVVFDEESLNYLRFMTHLRYFIQRLIEASSRDKDENFLYEHVKKEYPEAYRCTELINQYIYKNFKLILTQNEIVYLSIHIHRVTHR